VSVTNWVPIREERMPPARTTKRKLKTSLVRKEKRFRNGIREMEKDPRIFEKRMAGVIRAVSTFSESDKTGPIINIIRGECQTASRLGIRSLGITEERRKNPRSEVQRQEDRLVFARVREFWPET